MVKRVWQTCRNLLLVFEFFCQVGHEGVASVVKNPTLAVSVPEPLRLLVSVVDRYPVAE